MSDISVYIGKKIKDLRTAVGMTQTALSSKVEVTPNTVSRWESGVYQPRVEDLERLARVFEKPIAAFLPGVTQAASENQKALLSATGDLPPEDIQELVRYADFVRARRALRKKKK